MRQDPILVPKAQLESISSVYTGSNFMNGNARNIQNVGSRTIYMLERPDEPVGGVDNEEKEGEGGGATLITVIGAAMLSLTSFLF